MSHLKPDIEEELKWLEERAEREAREAEESREMEFDRDGYPTEQSLELLRQWDALDFAGILAFVKSGWKYPDRIKERVTKKGAIEVHISTGGWSGNESIISALQDNLCFFSFYWRTSRRGGHYRFKCPKREEGEKSATEQRGFD